MSAIIAGKKCKKCSGSWYVSLGHPKWFDDVVKRRKEPNVVYRTFEDCRHSGLCAACWLVDIVERAENKPDQFPIDFVNILTQALGIKP